jgi:ribosome recycling factor
MIQEDIYNDTNTEMSLIHVSLKQNLDKVRTGRVNLQLFESILVECYDKLVKLNQISSIIILSNNSVIITPWDKSNTNNINKALIKSDLGINPSVSDDTIKINFPAMNKERRLELVKYIKKVVENSKINMRNIRREKNNIVKTLLKNKDITKDEEKIMQEKIQDITNKFILEVNKCLKMKEIELMKI